MVFGAGVVFVVVGWVAGGSRVCFLSSFQPPVQVQSALGCVHVQLVLEHSAVLCGVWRLSW